MQPSLIPVRGNNCGSYTTATGCYRFEGMYSKEKWAASRKYRGFGGLTGEKGGSRGILGVNHGAQPGIEAEAAVGGETKGLSKNGTSALHLHNFAEKRTKMIREFANWNLKLSRMFYGGVTNGREVFIILRAHFLK